MSEGFQSDPSISCAGFALQTYFLYAEIFRLVIAVTMQSVVRATCHE